MVGTRLRAKFGVPAEKAWEMSDSNTQTKLEKKEASVQAVSCSECPGPSPGEKVSTHARCAQFGDLLHQVVELQETVKRLLGIRGDEVEIDR